MQKQKKKVYIINFHFLHEPRTLEKEDGRGREGTLYLMPDYWWSTTTMLLRLALFPYLHKKEGSCGDARKMAGKRSLKISWGCVDNWSTQWSNEHHFTKVTWFAKWLVCVELLNGHLVLFHPIFCATGTYFIILLPWGTLHTFSAMALALYFLLKKTNIFSS